LSGPDGAFSYNAGDLLSFGAVEQANYYDESTPGSYGFGLVGEKTTTPGLPSPGESYFKRPSAIAPVKLGGYQDVTQGVNFIPSFVYYLDYELLNSEKPTSIPGSVSTALSDYYLHITYSSDGTQYYGTMNFDSAGDLLSATYITAPEPEAWALLIAGAGLAGGALRRRRARSLAAI
jgi:hypothetical protein